MQCTGYYRILDNTLNSIEDLTDTLIVNCSGKMHKDTGFSANTSRNDFYLLYMTEGTMIAYFNGESKPVSAGMGIVYYPQTIYRYKFESQTPVLSYYWVHFTGSEALRTLQKFGFDNETVFDIGVHKNIIHFFDKIALEIIERKDNFAFAAGIYVVEILLQINRLCSISSDQVTKNRLYKSIEYIHSKFKDDISIEDLAQMENISPSRYRVVFKEVTGISPKSYLTNIRMNAACELLSQTTMPVNAIGKTIGYDNQMYFCRIFKQEMKTTPSQYRKMNSEIS